MARDVWTFNKVEVEVFRLPKKLPERYGSGYAMWLACRVGMANELRFSDDGAGTASLFSNLGAA